jgi:thiol-disulfide isomerase/thioredoxin
MKVKSLTGALLAAAMLSGCAGQSKDSCTLTGHISGLPENSVIVITPLSHENVEALAEVPVVNGEFQYTDTFPEAKVVLLSVKGSYGAMRVMLNNGDKVEITSDAVASDIEGTDMKSYDFQKDFKVKGSELTDKYLKLMSSRDTLNTIFEENNKRFAAIREAFGEARRNDDRAAMDSLSATEEFRLSAKADSTFFATVEQSYRNAVLSNKDSLWGPLMMISLTSYLTPDQRELFEQLSDEAKNSYYGKMVAAEIYPGGRPGDKMSDFTHVDANGVQQSLSSICKDSKYVILDFWASWCVPCRREIPNLKAIYAKHSAAKLQIVSVSIDQDAAAWRKALEEEALPWINIHDDAKSISSKYHVRAVPTIYIVDANGCLVAENIRGEELAAKIDELMK